MSGCSPFHPHNVVLLHTSSFCACLSEQPMVSEEMCEWVGAEVCMRCWCSPQLLLTEQLFLFVSGSGLQLPSESAPLRVCTTAPSIGSLHTLSTSPVAWHCSMRKMLVLSTTLPP